MSSIGYFILGTEIREAQKNRERFLRKVLVRFELTDG
jgi:hypothetical protein